VGKWWRTKVDRVEWVQVGRCRVRIDPEKYPLEVDVKEPDSEPLTPAERNRVTAFVLNIMIELGGKVPDPLYVRDQLWSRVR
jgi:hypothetical protein